jgi:hypothetical protein
MYTLLSVFSVLLLCFGVWIRIRFLRTFKEVYFGPNLHDRIDPIFAPCEGMQLSQEALDTLEAEAGRAFDDILTGVGLVPEGWKLKVRLDDLLGPVPEVHGPKARVLALAAFEKGLRERQIELPSA